MKYLAIALLLMGLSDRGFSLDVCNDYSGIHKSKILPRLESGIPFNLLCVVTTKSGETKEKNVKLSYDLWDEEVELKTAEGKLKSSNLDDSEQLICEVLSMADFNVKKPYTLTLMFNVPTDAMSKILREQLKKSAQGIFTINWSPVQKKSIKKSLILHKVVKQ